MPKTEIHYKQALEILLGVRLKLLKTVQQEDRVSSANMVKQAKKCVLRVDRNFTR
jgi:hypothetical protein